MQFPRAASFEAAMWHSSCPLVFFVSVICLHGYALSCQLQHAYWTEVPVPYLGCSVMSAPPHSTIYVAFFLFTRSSFVHTYVLKLKTFDELVFMSCSTVEYYYQSIVVICHLSRREMEGGTTSYIVHMHGSYLHVDR